MLQKILDKIESKREDRNFFWRFAVKTKDILWMLFYDRRQIQWAIWRYQERRRKKIKIRKRNVSPRKKISNKPKELVFSSFLENIALVFLKFNINKISQLQNFLRKIESKIKLKKITLRRINVSRDDLLLFVCVRNELTRVHKFLDYYREKGVDKFFFVDNNSDDGTKDYLLLQKDVVLFSTKESYARSFYGVNWLEVLLKKYGVGKWCLMVDIDEFFAFPHFEELSIKDLCEYLNINNETSIKAIMLDMYADGFPEMPEEGKKPLWEIFNYFDKDTHYSKEGIIQGGVRKRIFNTDVWLQKFPLLKYSKKIKFDTIHLLLNAKVSCVKGILFHFKFDSLFKERVGIEVGRAEHSNSAAEYKSYENKLKEVKYLSFFSSRYSQKYENSKQLVRMNIMKTTKKFEDYFNNYFLQE